LNKVMIVTGGSRGIGAATAVLAAQRGYAVCVNYVHNRAAATEVVATIVQAGGRAIAAPGDAANEADVGGHATEVAAAVLWPLSEEASYVTGAIIDVTGGR
jgi:NAD(P)-dependent dehydrogenase (short-subunit alcohol dehydrogenase family)